MNIAEEDAEFIRQLEEDEPVAKSEDLNSYSRWEHFNCECDQSNLCAQCDSV